MCKLLLEARFEIACSAQHREHERTFSARCFQRATTNEKPLRAGGATLAPNGPTWEALNPELPKEEGQVGQSLAAAAMEAFAALPDLDDVDVPTRTSTQPALLDGSPPADGGAASLAAARVGGPLLVSPDAADAHERPDAAQAAGVVLEQHAGAPAAPPADGASAPSGADAADDLPPSSRLRPRRVKPPPPLRVDDKLRCLDRSHPPGCRRRVQRSAAHLRTRTHLLTRVAAGAALARVRAAARRRPLTTRRSSSCSWETRARCV